MTTKARLIAGAAILGLATMAGAAVGDLPAGASTNSVIAAPVKGLLTAAQASRLNFTKVVGKPTTSSKTGVTGCAKGAEVAYEDSSGATGMISEVLVCKTASGPASVIKNVKATEPASATMLTPPKQLGVQATERATDGNTYAIYWQHGRILELLAFDLNVPASASSTTTTSIPAPPLSAQQQQVISKAALEQNAAVK